MEKLLQQIVSIEAEAQRLVEDAKRRRDTMNDEINAEADALRQKYREMASKRLMLVAEQEENAKREDIERLKGEYKARLEKLNEQFALHQQEWTARMCDAILGK